MIQTFHVFYIPGEKHEEPCEANKPKRTINWETPKL